MAEQEPERRGFPTNETPRPRNQMGEPDRVHSVGNQPKPTGGPFGPGKKKKPWEKPGPMGAKPKFGGGQGGARGGGGNFGGNNFGGGGGNFGGGNFGGGNFGGGGGERRTFRDSRSNFGAKPPRNFGNVAGPGQAGKPKWGHGKPTGGGGNGGGAAGRTDWSDVAEWYDDLVGDEGSEFHREVVLPGTKRLLGDVAGKQILDVACGQGVLSRQLHELGAIVTGVDAAQELLSAARERGPAEITYKYADAQELAGLEDNAYDAAACLLAIQNIASHQAVFTSVARCLKPGGVFVIVMMHPAFRSPKATQWGWVKEGDAQVQIRRVDRYLLPRKEPIITHPGKNDGEYTWTFHRPIGDYINAARKAGLLTDAMEELASHKNSDSGPRAAAENVARKEIPMFLAMRCVKVSAG